jgi:hypothetical protein
MNTPEETPTPTPQFIVRYRLLTVGIALLIILLALLGDFNIGPLAPLLGPAGPKINI